MPQRSCNSHRSGSEYETIDIEAELSGADFLSDEHLTPQQNKKHLKSRIHGENRSKSSKGKQQKVICTVHMVIS
jgi:hypothetical protein